MVRRGGWQVWVVTIVPVTHVLRLEGGVPRHQARGWGGGFVVTIFAVKLTNCIFSVNFHVFSERGWMCVALVTTSHLAVVWLVTGVHVRVLLAVTGVRESSITPIELAFERLFA